MNEKRIAVDPEIAQTLVNDLLGISIKSPSFRNCLRNPEKRNEALTFVKNNFKEFNPDAKTFFIQSLLEIAGTTHDDENVTTGMIAGTFDLLTSNLPLEGIKIGLVVNTYNGAVNNQSHDTFYQAEKLARVALYLTPYFPRKEREFDNSEVEVAFATNWAVHLQDNMKGYYRKEKDLLQSYVESARMRIPRLPQRIISLN